MLFKIPTADMLFSFLPHDSQQQSPKLHRMGIESILVYVMLKNKINSHKSATFPNDERVSMKPGLAANQKPQETHRIQTPVKH